MKSPFLKVLGIFAMAIAVLAAFGLVAIALIFGMQAVIFVDGAASIALLAIFSAIFWFTRLDWRRPELTAVTISVMSFVGMFMDSRGNPLYNQPLAWLFGSRGSHVGIREIVSHGGGSTGVNYEFQIVNAYGAVERLVSGWIVIPFRFVEYLAVLSLVVTAITLLRKASGSDWLPDNARE